MLFQSNELARWMQAPTAGNLEALKSRQILDWTWTLVQEFVREVEEPSHSVVFTDSDDTGCLRHVKAHLHPNCSVVLTCYVPPHICRVVALSLGESEFYAPVKRQTSAGLRPVSTLQDLGVDMSENTKIDRAALEVRVDASAGRGIAVRRPGGFVTLLLQHCSYKSSRRTA